MTTQKGFFGLLVFAVAAIGFVSPAFAGADVTFLALVTLVTDWLQGSLGTLLALVGTVFGIGAALSGRWGEMVTGFGVAAGAFYIPQIIPGITVGTL